MAVDKDLKMAQNGDECISDWAEILKKHEHGKGVNENSPILPAPQS